MLKFKKIFIKKKMLIKYNKPLLYYLIINNNFLNLNKFINNTFIIKFKNFLCLNCNKKKKKFLEKDIVKYVIL
ncbi:MAG: hypothetical protein NHG12_00580 [Candidatus Shikimatogenerans bostrichidophilus]|nr:MAG: hypothetical protein NHG12_00580 [Candidatus Shikimatogenerans bostrichidophilus]